MPSDNGPCAACGTPVRAEGRLLKCPACGMARRERPLSGAPDYSGLDENSIYSSAKRKVIPELVGLLSRHFRAPGALLDVGCASGELMKAAAAAGWKCAGVEPEPRLAARTAAAGFEVHAGTLETYEGPDGVLDAVVFYEVLSLVADPGVALGRAFSLLRPGGSVFIREHNAGFHLRAAALSASPLLRPLSIHPGIVHNWNHTPLSMRLMLERAGFAGVELANARSSDGDPYRTGGRLGAAGVAVFKKLYYGFSRAVSALSGGRALISSVFNARAVKPEAAP